MTARASVVYRWRADVHDAAVSDLHARAFAPGGDPYRWPQCRPVSLGWVSAHIGEELVGFLNVAWDGDRHAILLDLAVAPAQRRRGIGRRLVALAVEESRDAGCHWLHVDHEPHLVDFYAGCGFARTAAGVLRLDAGVGDRGG